MKTVFYSWQSDIQSNINRNVIEKAIVDAIKKRNVLIEDKTEQLTLDKDTINLPGSPDIVETIINKIDMCELFVADITPIASSEKGKAMPNSNVLFEAGYSVGKKGFARTVFILNEACSSVENLPFDLKTKRVLKYNLSQEDLSDLENKRNTIKALSSAISTSLKLLADLPPIEQLPDDPEQAVKRERDITKLRRFLEKMPSKVIQDHVRQGFDTMTMNFDTFTALYNIQSIHAFIGFRFYDKNLIDRINHFVELFDQSLSFGFNFYHLQNNIYKFSSSNRASEKDYLSVLNNLNQSLDSLLDYIHSNYVEIDIDEYESRAWCAYLEEINAEDSSLLEQ